jgi:hypothetical protein
LSLELVNQTADGSAPPTAVTNVMPVYRYAGNDPVGGSDPSGMWEKDEVLKLLRTKNRDVYDWFIENKNSLSDDSHTRVYRKGYDTGAEYQGINFFYKKSWSSEDFASYIIDYTESYFTGGEPYNSFKSWKIGKQKAAMQKATVTFDYDAKEYIVRSALGKEIRVKEKHEIADVARMQYELVEKSKFDAVHKYHGLMTYALGAQNMGTGLAETPESIVEGARVAGDMSRVGMRSMFGTFDEGNTPDGYNSRVFKLAVQNGQGRELFNRETGQVLSPDEAVKALHGDGSQNIID